MLNTFTLILNDNDKVTVDDYNLAIYYHILNDKAEQAKNEYLALQKKRRRES